MPKVSSAHRDARRAQILEAACRCFQRRGIRATSIRDICREARLSLGAVYGYFEHKEAIIEAVAQRGRENTACHLEAIRLTGVPTRDLTRLLCEAVELLDSKAGLESTRLNVRFWSEGLDSKPIRTLLAESIAQTLRPFEQHVRGAQAEAVVSDTLDATSTAQVLVAVHMGLSLLKALDPNVKVGGCVAVIQALLEGTFVTP
jgi:AcrR family transcriptional regulator